MRVLRVLALLLALAMPLAAQKLPLTTQEFPAAVDPNEIQLIVRLTAELREAKLVTPTSWIEYFEEAGRDACQFLIDAILNQVDEIIMKSYQIRSPELQEAAEEIRRIARVIEGETSLAMFEIDSHVYEVESGIMSALAHVQSDVDYANSRLPQRLGFRCEELRQWIIFNGFGVLDIAEAIADDADETIANLSEITDFLGNRNINVSSLISDIDTVSYDVNALHDHVRATWLALGLCGFYR